jgi:asparagine synthase (glutamine-hydrolysing)
LKSSEEVILSTVSRIVKRLSAAGVDSFLDRTMYLNLLSSTSDSNYRLPDISGLAAQVEVRSPYLDYRLVEFAARLPDHFKVGDPHDPGRNKYLPKIYYERFVSKEIAWASKKGMGMNLQWGRSIVRDPAYLAAFENTYKSLEQVGLDASEYRAAWMDYRNGDRLRAGPMMAGFMLGMWLCRPSISQPVSA